jgi:hypothetical protein
MAPSPGNGAAPSFSGAAPFSGARAGEGAEGAGPFHQERRAGPTDATLRDGREAAHPPIA